MSLPICHDNASRVGGGLIRTPAPIRKLRGTLREGADVSWLPKVRVGNDQGQVGACAIFAMAHWAEIVHGYNITDQQCLDVYAQKCKDMGRGDEGLAFPDAFAAAVQANWLPGARKLEQVSDLTELANQPVLCGYTVTPAWRNPNAAGCLDHTAPYQDLGGHATVIAAHGSLQEDPGAPLVFVLNSWGLPWGWKGLCVMEESLHHDMCNELWVIRT